VDDIPSMVQFALKEQIDLTIVGPELPLSLGICDEFKKNGLKIFGPSQRAARIESSKSFSKEMMVKYHIPTASAKTFSSPEPANEHIRGSKKPLVVKADGLAAGKGVIIAQTDAEAIEAVDSFMSKKSLGDAGKSVVIEEFLEGEEISFLVITDGKTILPLASAQDHKRIFDGDKGPNTGGMGAYSPVPFVETQKLEGTIIKEVMIPIVKAMEQEGSPFSGFLYGGLMMTKEGIKVLEFNARLGDPETQAILPLLDSDFVEIIDAAVNGRLESIKLKWSGRSAVCVVVASEGYPGKIKGKVPITGLEKSDAFENNCFVFHSGTERKDKTLLASGGRVLGVTAWGNSLEEARTFAYQSVSKIHFQGMQYRTDIARKALRR
jgi:phosphoribosylamine--glycine ligase